MTNLEVLAYSGRRPVPLIDSYYNKGSLVITPAKGQSNELMKANSRLIELITVFNYLNGEGLLEDAAEIQRVVENVVKILDSVEGINYSAFSQFFMVYNSTYNSYSKFDGAKKRRFVYAMLLRYCEERHGMYLSHGYSDAILQVMCDNYSHKRNSKTTIDKITDTIETLGFKRLSETVSFESSDNFYFLPDKGDAGIYHNMVSSLSLETRALRQEQDKLPDFIIKIDGDYYIGEAKMMKGSGGGQDKQLVEIINFIRYQERQPNVHYVVYFDGEYANMLLSSTDRSPKIERQYQDIVKCLTENPKNFFVNPDGFIVLLNDLLQGVGK